MSGEHLIQLEYQFNELEPYIDTKTMEFHYGKHYAGYVQAAKEAKEAIERSTSLQEAYLHSRKYDNQLGGALYHELFFTLLAPKGKGGGVYPTQGKFHDLIVERFGSFDGLKEKMIAAGMTLFGSGWVILTDRLEILTTPNQEILRPTSRVILAIDLWEHAYYLKYQNRRLDYLQAIFEVISWSAVERLI